mgnify:CR=1 FL=1
MELGVTQSAFSRWMGGSNNPRLETIKAIADTLKVPVSQLIDPNLNLPSNSDIQLSPGYELSGPGLMSAAKDDVVPSNTHNSSPLMPSLAWKYSLLL